MFTKQVGIKIDVTVRTPAGAIFDLSAATTKNMRFRLGDGTVITRSATFITNGTDGQLRYVTVAGDFDVPCEIALQVYLVLPTGTFYTSRTSFTVEAIW